MNKAINYILSTETFEQQCVGNKGELQSTFLERHMMTIVIDQLLCNRSSFVHKCLNEIRNIYQHAGKCYDQQNFKDILDAAMGSTPE